MIYDALMFDQSTNTKIELYSLISSHAQGVFSANYFGDKLYLNYHQITRAIIDIEEDLAQINPNHASFQFETGKINIRKTKINIDEYRRYLLKDSVPYLFILECLKPNPRSIDEFCDDLHISRSTLSRKMQPLSDYLREHDLRVTYTPINIKGDEALVRHSIWALLWIGLRGNTWPLKDVSTDYVNKLLELGVNQYITGKKNIIAQKELSLFIGVIVARWQAGHFCRKKYQWDKIFSTSKGFRKFELDFEFPDADIAANEYEQVVFLSILTPHYSTDRKDLVNLLISELYEKNSDEPYSIFSKKLLEYLNQELFLEKISSADERLILANILVVFFTVYTYSGSYPTIEELSGTNAHENRWINTIRDKIFSFYQDVSHIFENDFVYYYDAMHKIIPTLSNLLLPYYFYSEEHLKVRVAVSMEGSKLDQHRIRMFLSLQSFVELHDFDEKAIENYDLVISTSTSTFKQFKVKEGFLWDVSYDYQEVCILFQTLQDIWFRNNQFKKIYAY